MMRILFVCTGNAGRSQMAAAFLQSFDPRLKVESAGTVPAAYVHPKAVAVMREVGIDLSKSFPKSVDRFLDEEFDYVITVCDNTRESCPPFRGRVKNRVHIGLEDPAEATGSEEEVLEVYRRIRDEIQLQCLSFYKRLNG
jgi:arsenate reductase